MELISRLEQLRSQKNTNSFIAKFILDNIFLVSNMSITNLSKETFVSPTTINRFCKTVGFEGYKEFQFELKKFSKLLCNKNSSSNEKLDDFNFSENIDILKNLLTVNINDIMEQLLQNKSKLKDIFFNIEQINLIGFGTNTIAQKYFAYLFSTLNDNIHIVYSSELDTNRFFIKQSKNKKAVNIVFSYTLNSSFYLDELIQISLDNKQKIVCLTGNDESKYLDKFDVVIFAYNSEINIKNRVNFLASEIFFTNALYLLIKEK
ncbi:MurR/RpiR family transcriptional regulator [Spiroplasma gladiatoris]|uniref:MurR/RpiR family transcriptional regulator n=1 Tax=Spiroplasma gladiatoris TaxID=2143 RepID=A0A4P7AHZ4_9MOLU|nr:MurR/RpiR family transcriptional regulator [Spiroplasma gladiatoris]QBQ07771.1 MurR/RpiR family transcriptional regulator [Spiroplasma gladiatoris]